MIDFEELPDDGNALEQLTRELLVVAGLRVQWTGKGADQGRDLLADEDADGPLGSFRRRWLVQCKHNAHGRKSVGRKDLASVIDDCRQVGADGYLLVCSTQPSSGVVTKLREIADTPANRLVTAFWDSVELEKRLTEPRGFALAHQFFPVSMKDTPWKIYNAGSPSRWAAHYKDAFLYLSSRISSYLPSLDEVATIVQRLAKIPVGKNESVRVRAVYFDDKHEQFQVFADYMIPAGRKPKLAPSDFEARLHDGQGLHYDADSMWYLTYWDISPVRTNRESDRFHLDSAEYYEPHLRNFETGSPRDRTIGEVAESEMWWQLRG